MRLYMHMVTVGGVPRLLMAPNRQSCNPAAAAAAAAATATTRLHFAPLSLSLRSTSRHVHAANPSIDQCIHARTMITWSMLPIDQRIHAQTIITPMLPTHPLARASMPKPFINKCFRAETSLMLIMRHYRPCPVFQHCSKPVRKKTHRAEHCLKPPSRPATALPCQNQATRTCSNIEFCSADGDTLFNNANIRKYGPCHAVQTLFEDKLEQTTVMDPTTSAGSNGGRLW